MAAIHETLTLEDKFSATFSKFLQMGEKASGASQKATQAAQNYATALSDIDIQLIRTKAQLASAVQEQNAMISAGEQATASFSALNSRIEELSGTVRDLTRQYDAVEKEADQATAAAKQFDSQTKQVNSSANALTGTLKRMVGLFASLQTVKWLINTSDQITQADGRLKLMTGSAEAAAEANEMIYNAAMRSRGAYSDMLSLVTQLGTLAPEAFSGADGSLNTGELVAFSEQLQKLMAISNTSSESASAAMLQLTQGLSSGTLRGEELNSVLEQTPMIAQTIADYLGMTIGELREFASEGGLTADIVKNAVLGATDETNAAFEELPMTWAQVWQIMGNVALKALQPILNGINWLANNFEKLIPIISGVAAGVLFLGVALSIASGSAGTLISMFASLAQHPALLIIAAAIGVIIGLIAKWVQSVGGLQIAWLTAADKVLYAGDTIKVGFYQLVIAIANWLDEFGLILKAVGNAIADSFGDTKVVVLGIIEGMINGAIDLINKFINLVNNIIGISFDTIDHVTFGATAAIENEAAKQARAEELAEAKKTVMEAAEERAQNLADKMAERDENSRVRQQEIEALKASLEDGAGPSGSNYDSGKWDGVPDDVSSIKKSVTMADEDLQDLIDMAERQYINQINLTAQTPVITINGANTGNTEEDRRRLGDTIRDIILEQAAAGSYRSTARVYSGG